MHYEVIIKPKLNAKTFNYETFFLPGIYMLLLFYKFACLMPYMHSCLMFESIRSLTHTIVELGLNRVNLRRTETYRENEKGQKVPGDGMAMPFQNIFDFQFVTLSYLLFCDDLENAWACIYKVVKVGKTGESSSGDWGLHSSKGSRPPR